MSWGWYQWRDRLLHHLSLFLVWCHSECWSRVMSTSWSTTSPSLFGSGQELQLHRWFISGKLDLRWRDPLVFLSCFPSRLRLDVLCWRSLLFMLILQQLCMDSVLCLSESLCTSYKNIFQKQGRETTQQVSTIHDRLDNYTHGRQNSLLRKWCNPRALDLTSASMPLLITFCLLFTNEATSTTKNDWNPIDKISLISLFSKTERNGCTAWLQKLLLVSSPDEGVSNHESSDLWSSFFFSQKLWQKLEFHLSLCFKFLILSHV